MEQFEELIELLDKYNCNSLENLIFVQAEHIKRLEHRLPADDANHPCIPKRGW